MAKVKKILKGFAIVVGVVVIIWLAFTNNSKDKKIEALENRLNENTSSEITTEAATEETTGGEVAEKPESSIEEIRAGLAAVNETVKELTEKLDAVEEKSKITVTEDVYLDVKFPHDGNYYKDARETQFYADSTCTEKIFNVRFYSAEIDDARAENGLYIYCLRMDNGQICYCTESPYLITEEAYKEYTAGK